MTTTDDQDEQHLGGPSPTAVVAAGSSDRDQLSHVAPDVPCLKETQLGFCDRPDHRDGSMLRRLRIMKGRTEVQMSVEALDHDGGRLAVMKELRADLAALEHALTLIGSGTDSQQEHADPTRRSEAPNP